MLLFAKVLGLVGLIIGSIEDVRTREVPDWLSFSLIIGGLGSAVIFSYYLKDWSYAVNSAVGFGIAVAIAYGMYYTAQWGGGDSKLLMGMGALFGVDIFNPGIPLLLIFLANIFLFGAVYGLLWSAYLAGRNWNDFRKAFKKLAYSKKVSTVRKANLALSFLILIGIFFSPLHVKIFLFGILLLSMGSIYLWIFVKSIENSAMIVEIPVKKLTEGDWVVDEVKLKGKRICGPGDLGITKKKIEILQNSKIKKVRVREGIPFVPSFLFGFILTMIFGNWLIYLV